MDPYRPQYSGEVNYDDELYQKDYLYYIDTDFDDNEEGFYEEGWAKKAAPKDPRRYIDNYTKDEFNGSHWKPKKFIKILYLRNIYNTAKSFLKELQEIDFSSVPAKKTITTHLKNAKVALKKADRLYEVDQISSLNFILDAIEEGRKVVERLKLYAIQKKI